MELVKRLRKRRETENMGDGFIRVEWEDEDALEAADLIEWLVEALRPFAQEALYWENYDSDEHVVESFSGYGGDLTVGDLRNAFNVLKLVKEIGNGI